MQVLTADLISNPRQVVAGQEDAAALGAKVLLYISGVRVAALGASQVGQVVITFHVSRFTCH